MAFASKNSYGEFQPSAPACSSPFRQPAVVYRVCPIGFLWVVPSIVNCSGTCGGGRVRRGCASSDYGEEDELDATATKIHQARTRCSWEPSRSRCGAPRRGSPNGEGRVPRESPAVSVRLLDLARRCARRSAGGHRWVLETGIYCARLSRRTSMTSPQAWPILPTAKGRGRVSFH